MIPCSSHHIVNLVDINSGPLSTRILMGLPRHEMICSSIRMMRSAGNDVSISIARASRLKSSTRLNTLNFLPDISASLMKSIDQVSLRWPTMFNGWRTLAGNRFLPLRFIFSFNILYTRWMRLWFHNNPSLRILKYIFQNPSVGRLSAIRWSFSTTGPSSRMLR